MKLYGLMDFIICVYEDRGSSEKPLFIRHRLHELPRGCFNQIKLNDIYNFRRCSSRSPFLPFIHSDHKFNI